jgi:hypothetical protein
MTATIVSFGCPDPLQQDNATNQPGARWVRTSGMSAYFQNGLAFVKALKDATAAARVE